MTPRCGVVTRPAGSVLPLPPSAPRPPSTQSAPPSLWHGDQSWEAKARATAPSPLQPRPLPTIQPHPTAPLVQPRTIFWGSVLLNRRMRFWLRNEEMALEEMVQRLNAVSKNTGRRSCWP